MPGSTKQIAPVQNKCVHDSQTDDEKKTNPLDNWCDECQMSCCRECFTNDHEPTHKWSGTEQTKLINKIRKDPKKYKADIAKVKDPKHKADLDKRAKPRATTRLLTEERKP